MHLKLCHRATETSCKKQKLARQISCEKLTTMNSTNYDEKKSMAQNAYKLQLPFEKRVSQNVNRT